MATINTYERGIEDILCTMTLSGIDDTADLTEIEIKVYHAASQQVIGTYTFTGGTVTKVEPTTSCVIVWIVGRDDTEDQPTGLYRYQIETTENDDDYPEGKRHRSASGECFIINPSI